MNSPEKAVIYSTYAAFLTDMIIVHVIIIQQKRNYYKCIGCFNIIEIKGGIFGDFAQIKTENKPFTFLAQNAKMDNVI